MLDRTLPLPMYYQLKELIREELGAGKWQPGDLIPSERELSERYGISRMTARQALTELTNEGLLRREQGKGTFVSEPRIEQRLTRLTGFTEDMRKRGLRPGVRVLRLEAMDAPVRVAEALQIEPGVPIVLLERLRLAESTPMAIETGYVYFDRAHKLLEEDYQGGSLYHLLAEKYDVVPTRAEQQIEAALCSQRRRELLELDEVAPVLRTKRVTYEQRGRPFEYVEAIYRADRYVFHVELTTL